MRNHSCKIFLAVLVLQAASFLLLEAWRPALVPKPFRQKRSSNWNFEKVCYSYTVDGHQPRGRLRLTGQSFSDEADLELPQLRASSRPPSLPVTATTATTIPASPLSCSIEDLADIVGGSGRAEALWDCYRRGIDPLALTADDSSAPSSEVPDSSSPPLGGRALRRLRQCFPSGSLSRSVARVASESASSDGTIKMLLELQFDGRSVEAVLIPWFDRRTTTLCVSSQLGCRQACTFCATGRMGMIRSLSVDEILVQVFYAQNLVRNRDLPPLDNVVFMGMGEPADNAVAVVQAANALVHPHRFALAPRKVTVSTVAPTPGAFETLMRDCPVALAWSVHASRDEIRRWLVPTTRHTMEDLRIALVRALNQRSRRQRSVMLEVALIQGVNDSFDDASHLAKFAQSIVDDVPHAKVVVNLIPWNDIRAASGPASRFQAPSRERVLAFQSSLIRSGIRCYLRTTRGDDEMAACGQLATRSKTTTMTTRRKGGPS